MSSHLRHTTLAPSLDRNERSLQRLAEVGRDFVARWQDFLIQRQHGEIDRAHSIVESLAQTAASEPIYPRAQLLEIAASLRAKPADTIPRVASAAAERHPLIERLAGLKTLEDLDAQIAALTGEGAKFPIEYSTVSHDLERIHLGFAALRSGDFHTAGTATFGGFNKHPKLVELKAQLAVRLAAVMLRAEGPLAPREGESLRDFIHRLATDAQQRKDWKRLRQVLETPASIPGKHDAVNLADTTAVRTYLAGRNLDEASVWPLAVSSYIQALKAGSDFVPTDEITQRIEAIRREHPEDYKRGSEQAIEPKRESLP